MAEPASATPAKACAPHDLALSAAEPRSQKASWCCIGKVCTIGGSAAAGHATLNSTLKTFPAAYSPQNFVLVLDVPPQETLVGGSVAAPDNSAAAVPGPDGYSELRSLARFCTSESTAAFCSACV